MSNDYYDHDSGEPAVLSRGASPTIRAEFDLVKGGFDKLPSTEQLWSDSANYVQAAGSADAWTASLAALFLTSYQPGMRLAVKFPSANTSTTPTINVNGIGAVVITGDAGTPLAAGDIAAGSIRTLTYDSGLGKFVMFLGNSVASAQAAAVAAATSAAAASGSAGAAATSANDAAGSASASASSAGASLSYSTNAQTSATSAANAASATQLNGRIFTSTAAALSKGVSATSGLVAGSGGTNGTFDLAFSGGGGSGALGRFVVAGGAVQSVIITAPGSGYTSAPTVSFAASAGLTGASVTAVIADNAPSGTLFSVPSTTTGEYEILYLNNGGVAQEQGRFYSAANFSALNGDPNAIFADIDSSGEWAAAIVTPQGVYKFKNAVISSLTATTSTVGTQTVTGTSTVGALNTSQQQIPTTDLGYLNELIATLDASGEWAAMAVNKDGSVRFGKVVTGNMQVTGTLSLNSVSATAASAVTLNGAGANAVVARALSRGPLCKTDVVHHPGYGQSNMKSNYTGGGVVLSTTQLYDSLRFNGGVRPTDGGAGTGGTGVRTAFSPLVEQVSGIYGETMCTAAAEMIKYLLSTENGLTYNDPTHPQTFRQLFSDDAEGGKTIAQLADISLFQRVIDSITSGVSLTNAAGYTYYAPAGPYVQGENDGSAGTPRATYRDALETSIRLPIQSQIQSQSGQTDPYYLLCAQVASQSAYGVPPTIPMAQYDAGRLYPYIRIFFPMWFATYQIVDYIHMDAASQRLMGWYYGIFWKRLIVDQKDWHPLEPVEFFKQGNVCRMRFNVPVGQLTRDTTNVPADTADGFRLFDSVGSPVTINSVTQTGPDTLTVVGASSWKEIRCATEATTAGHTGKTQGGPRCNWRDQQGDSLVYNSTAMHNYMVSFGKTF